MQVSLDLVLLLVGILFLLVSLLFWKLTKRFRQRIAGLLPLILCGIFLLLGGHTLILSGYAFWYTHRPIPANTTEVLFDGITYTREAFSTSHPMMVYVVQVDLTDPGISFLVTPGELTDGRQLRARKTSDFLSEFGLQLAVNGDFFLPWWSYTPWDFAPHFGEGADVFGIAASRGTIYSKNSPERPVLYISANNEVSFNQPIGEIYNAISGNIIFVEQGKVVTNDMLLAYHSELHPRTAVGLSKDGKTLLLFVVDGRQPSFSEGIALTELADIVIRYGAYTAMNLDGGGSTTLVIEGENSFPVFLNSPIDNRIPGRERVVGNHFGIYAHRIDN
jgi:hypothetical protein